ncbi:MAG: FAD-binding oxidoreductase [Eudoraea sp.]|nr:FAD-binding oxidoreductase [Eudoraea sp.]NNJ39664.1 FAD-binding oxidoreductase [Eudoraea sp.]
MELSYWEHKSWLSNVDYTVIGSGIVGLSCALHLKETFPKAKILILEKGLLPQGASTKNAGFACFGSISEILADLQKHSEAEVLELVTKRFQGIQRLRKLLGDQALKYKETGGHELFMQSDQDLYEKCLESMDSINELVSPVLGPKAFVHNPNTFRFQHIQKQYITNVCEGQIDTGNMMLSLLQKVQESGVLILNGITVKDYQTTGDGVVVRTEAFELKTSKLLMATNGFASKFIGAEVKPARAQVLITEPIPELHIQGTFHLEEGFYYFRDIDNRILLGGGRNLDFKTEETEQFGQTSLVQQRLEQLLSEVILPGKEISIASRWSGIMGVGAQKKPIVKALSNQVYCGVRLGGMGIAIGSMVGKELADLAG